MNTRKLKDKLKAVARRAGYTFERLRLDDVAQYVALFGQRSVDERRFYNVSGGGHFGFGGGLRHPCWTNVDVDRPWPAGAGAPYDPSRDIAHDPLSLTPLPLASDSAELVHSRVTIEHMPDEAARLLLAEIHRVLKPSGVFRVVAPNMELDLRALARGDRAYFGWARPQDSLEQAFLTHFAANASTRHPDGASTRITDDEFRHALATRSPEDALDWCVSRCSLEVQRRTRSDHINWWTPAKLHRELAAAGFETAYLSAPQQSACPVLRNPAYFDNVFIRFLFHMEAVKG
jgi:SAM-dependent methyltransferase